MAQVGAMAAPEAVAGAPVSSTKNWLEKAYDLRDTYSRWLRLSMTFTLMSWNVEKGVLCTCVARHSTEEILVVMEWVEYKIPHRGRMSETCRFVVLMVVRVGLDQYFAQRKASWCSLELVWAS